MELRGKLITFEGTEGAGKSTLIKLLARKIKKTGVKVSVTREPGGTPLAEKIRKLILKEPLSPLAELFCYEASRAEHMQTLIFPKLKEGHLVICDRFTDSTLAYQSEARGLDWGLVKKLNQMATSQKKPDLTVWLDIDPQKGLQRASDWNRFEKEGLLFQKKVRKGFLKSMKENPKRWLHIKVKEQTPEQLCEIVLKRLKGSSV
ncbi:MAG: dTMP kinase [Bdellovibrionaceae bacterium]|nr:dTMP kinase [Pseudobdellovibrionaceae bacterium]|tara:strand:- start:2376 stop:2987 length:612 start_codon:yes stop_codon:yes gene_type:complete